jgi:hypothetical protein
MLLGLGLLGSGGDLLLLLPYGHMLWLMCLVRLQVVLLLKIVLDHARLYTLLRRKERHHWLRFELGLLRTQISHRFLTRVLPLLA